MGKPCSWLERLYATRIGKGQADHREAGAHAGTRWNGDEEDSILVLTPGRGKPSITVPGFCVLLAAFILLKSVVIAWLGPGVYEEAIRSLQQGTVFEQAGAFIMRPDFFSEMLADQFRALIL